MYILIEDRIYPDTSSDNMWMKSVQMECYHAQNKCGNQTNHYNHLYYTVLHFFSLTMRFNKEPMRRMTHTPSKSSPFA